MSVLRVELQAEFSRCVETAARDEYQRGVRRLLAGEGEEGLAEKTELLRLFLETADFRELRRESERHLLEGKKVTFLVCLDEGTLRYELRAS